MKNPSRKFLSLVALLFVLFGGATIAVTAQTPSGEAAPSGSGISLAPARVELAMQPGAETTVVVNLDYHGEAANMQPVRIVASLNDWTISPNGEVAFQKANTLPNSASPWLIYSPAETTVIPGNVHSIRVTISVPKDATPGDHLTSLIVEQRPDSLKLTQNQRQVVVRYRMAAVFYIKVGQLVQKGSLEGLRAEAHPDGVVVVPTLKNQGNSVLRPLTSVKVMDAKGKLVAVTPDQESLPVLGGAELSQPLKLEQVLAPGVYNVTYRVDFQDGTRPTEGITELNVGVPTVAAKSVTAAKPLNQ
jgi:hypothetical protein